jgi:hypothetical protein
VVLDKDGVGFYRSWATGKPPTDRLFTTAEGKPWRRDTWAEQVRSAIAVHNKRTGAEARIPEGASAYGFRHARISELLHVYGVDPLTVAAQTGTSLRMIERAYFKFIRSAILEKLASLSANPVEDRDLMIMVGSFGTALLGQISTARFGRYRAGVCGALSDDCINN